MNLKVPEKRAVWKDYLLIYNDAVHNDRIDYVIKN